MWGSIAQNYRCTVGTASGSRPFDITHGYSKAYRYDSRLGFRTPPYMLKLSDDPWRDSRLGEVSPALQAVGSTINYSLVPSDEPGGVISDVTLSTGPGTCPGSPTNCIVSGSGNAKYVPITATGAGLIVVTYALTPSGSSLSETRRVVILAN
jgi:hypothetical protein